MPKEERRRQLEREMESMLRADKLTPQERLRWAELIAEYHGYERNETKSVPIKKTIDPSGADDACEEIRRWFEGK